MKLIIATIAGTISVLFGFLFATNVVKVNVCHNTGSPQNPYVLVVVSVQSVEDAINLGGHGRHEDDAWHPYVFEDVTYPGRNEDLFGTIIDDNCNLITPPTDTPTPTNTEAPSATPTETQEPTATTIPSATATSTETPTTDPRTPTSTPTFTPTYTSTPTDAVPTLTSTPTNTPTGTWLPPTNTPTIQATNTPTSTNVPPTSTPTITATNTPTLIPTFTPTSPTNTPFPPKAANASDNVVYPGDELGTLYIGENNYKLYKGVNASDGSLLLPSAVRGAALYNGTIWIHRQWNIGWLDIKPGNFIYIDYIYEGSQAYFIGNKARMDYGTYPPSSPEIKYLATCYKDSNGKWAGIELFLLRQAKSTDQRR